MTIQRTMVAWSLLVASCSAYSTPIWAGRCVLVGALGSDADLQAFKAKLEASGEEVQILQDRSGKHGNDNTFVQFYNPHFNVPEVRVDNRKTYIVIPQVMNYDTLMEVLLKVRAAKTLGASQVIVQSSIPLRQVVLAGPLAAHLSLEEFLATAGAEVVLENGSKRELIESKPRKNSVSRDHYWIGGSAHFGLVSEITSILQKSIISFETLQVLSPEALAKKQIYWVASGDRPVNENFFVTLAQIRFMAHRGAVVHLVSPYLPYARSDKPEFEVGVTTQGRLAADLIESVGTQGITVVRAHAPQSLGFFKIYAHEIAGRKTIVDYLASQNIDCIISPDAGFQKDATKYQTELLKAYHGKKSNVCLVVMNKERDSEGREKILGGNGVEQIAGKRVVIVDDETATGGTLAQVAGILQEYHPENIFAVVTHLAGPAEKSLGSKDITKLVVTNTLPISITHEKLEKLSIAAEIAESIARTEENR